MCYYATVCVRRGSIQLLLFSAVDATARLRQAPFQAQGGKSGNSVTCSLAWNRWPW